MYICASANVCEEVVINFIKIWNYSRFFMSPLTLSHTAYLDY